VPVDGTPRRRRFIVSLASVMTGEATTMRWLINGRTFAMDDYPVTVERGATEVWELHNQQQGMPHPMHLHGRSFRVLGRAGSPQ
jgi:FtsP/CotA-like multicopper oxidase with cupredoxin domain